MLGFAAMVTAVSAQIKDSVRTGSGLQHEVTVTRKLIHVLVTDRNGKPVTDLKKDEFILFDNGQRMTLTEFESHKLSLPGEEKRPAAPEQGDKPPAPVLEPVPAPAPGLAIDTSAPAVPLMSRTFFFLFDLIFADAGGMRLAREAALRYLETELDATDQIAVLSFAGGRSLTAHHIPGLDRDAARQAIESLGPSNLRSFVPLRAREDGSNIKVGGSTDFIDSSGIETSRGGFGVGRIVAGNFVWALDALAQALSSVPGRKVIILYSNGLHPSYLGRGEFLEMGNADLGQAYQDVCRKLAAANASVFAVNTEENTYLVAGVRESQKGVSSLREIAMKTGGQFIGDTYAVPDHMEKISTMTAAYYVLGYPITESWKGEYHKVKVKVTRPDCEVNAQPGYYAAKPFAEYSELEKKIHLIDVALSEKPLSQEPVRFTMQALPWSFDPSGDIRFLAEVPVGRLGDVVGSRLEAVSLVFNQLDEIVATRRTELDLLGQEMGGRAVFFHAALSAPSGIYKCSIVLRNMESGRAAVAGASTVVPAPESNEIMLFPPLFLVSKGQPFYLDGEAPKEKKSGLADKNAGKNTEAGLFRGFPVDSTKYAPLFDEPLSSGREILAIAYCAAREKEAADLKLSACLKSLASGQEIVLPLDVLSDKAEKRGRSFLLSLTLPDAFPGEYNLVLSAELQGSKSGVIRRIRIE